MPGGAGPIATSINPFKTRIVERGWYTAFALVTSLFFLFVPVSPCLPPPPRTAHLADLPFSSTTNSWGFCYGLLDVLNSHFQKVLGISKLQSTGLQVAYFGIGCVASPAFAPARRRLTPPPFVPLPVTSPFPPSPVRSSVAGATSLPSSWACASTRSARSCSGASLPRTPAPSSPSSPSLLTPASTFDLSGPSPSSRAATTSRPSLPASSSAPPSSPAVSPRLR